MADLPLRMPKMSMTMESGEILAWHKREGDSVRAGDIVCEVATDKVDMDVEAPADGVLARIVAAPGQKVAVGEPIAYLSSETEDILADILPPSTPDRVEESAAPPQSTAPAEYEATPPSRKGPRPAIPRARRLAAELGIDLETVTPTGRGGVITPADVERAAQRHRTSPPRAPENTPDTAAFADALRDRRTRLRSVIAHRMQQSAAIPQFTVFRDIIVDTVARSRQGIGWTTLFVKALALALRENGDLTTPWLDDGPGSPTDDIAVAIAVDTPVGLLAPVVHHADTISLTSLQSEVRGLVDRARSGKLTATELEGAVTTVSNLGTFGVDMFQALLTPPQPSVLALGAVRPTLVATGDGFRVRTVCTVGLTVDHRVADGADAARLLDRLAQLFATPPEQWAGPRPYTDQ